MSQDEQAALIGTLMIRRRNLRQQIAAQRTRMAFWGESLAKIASAFNRQTPLLNLRWTGGAKYAPHDQPFNSKEVLGEIGQILDWDDLRKATEELRSMLSDLDKTNAQLSQLNVL